METRTVLVSIFSQLACHLNAAFCVVCLWLWSTSPHDARQLDAKLRRGQGYDKVCAAARALVVDCALRVWKWRLLQAASCACVSSCTHLQADVSRVFMSGGFRFTPG